MKTTTWIPGTFKDLDEEFEYLRSKQYDNKNHRLWKNYSKESFLEVSALTICRNDDDVPEICSSIVIRDCWPASTYRILNRLWKHSNKVEFPKKMSLSFAETAKSQINWLQENTDCKLFFISRQTDNWEDWVIKNFKTLYGIDFKKGQGKYLTCSNENDLTCWQNIIYRGDEQLLRDWKKCL